MRTARGSLLAAMRPYLIRRRIIGAAGGLLLGLAFAGLAAGLLALLLGRGVLEDPLLRATLAVTVALPALARAAMPQRPLHAALAIERAFPFLQDRVATAVDLLTREPGRVPRSEAATIRVAEEATAALSDLPIARAAPARTIRTPALIAALGLGLAALAWATAPVQRAPEPGPPAPQIAPEAPEEAAPAPPRVYDLTVTVDPPRYCRLPRRTFTDDLATIRALAGSTVTIAAVCSRQDARVTFATDAAAPVTLRQAPGGRVSHALVVTAPIRWRLIAQAGHTSSATPWRTIECLADAAPRVSLLRPEGDLTLAIAEPVAVSVAADDDFGISAMGLRFRVVSDGADRSGLSGSPPAWRSLPLEFAPGASASASARLNPAGIGLRPGGELVVVAWATDNDAITGPKTATSAPVRIRLAPGAEPQRGEPETPVEAAQREEQDALEELERTARELQRQLQEAIEGAMGGGTGEGREMQPRPGLELQEAARRLQEQAGRLEQAMRNAERELTSQEMLSPELVQKVRELHELMRDVLDEEMRRALEELQKAIEAQDLEQMRMSLEAAREAQEQFMRRLEQTLALLKRARMEALLGQLRQLAEELARRQAALTDRTRDLSEGQSQQARETGRDQKLLARDTEPLAERVEDAVAMAREIAEDLAVKLGAIADRLRREDPAGQMRRAAGALDRGSPSDAQPPQQEAGRALEQAAADLGALERQLAADFTAEARRKLAAMLRDTLALSHAQEALREDVRDLGRRGRADLLRDKRPIAPLRRRQTTLSEATRGLASRMAALARETPVMNPMLAAAAEVIADEMAQAAREVEGADLATALMRGRNAMAGLNEVARLLLETSEQLSQQSAQSALAQYMERLKSLAQRQEGLNQQTGQAQQGESGERLPGQGPAMSLSQMAFEQAMIREALKQMLREGREGEGTGSVADQLGGVPEEMEKVEGDLRSGRIKRETVERQERILEKMLEAQRSLYTKEQERSERKAERPSAFEPPPSPPAIAPSLMSRPSLRIERGRGAQTLPRGYEEFVREYYRRLGEEPPR